MWEPDTLFAPIVELLSVLVRTGANSTVDEETHKTKGFTQDVVAVVAVLQRNNRPDVRPVDLTDARLVGVQLSLQISGKRGLPKLICGARTLRLHKQPCAANERTLRRSEAG